MVTLSRGDRLGNRLFCHESSSCDHFVADGGGRGVGGEPDASVSSLRA